ncbi:transposase [Sagittula salina]|uniref:transposase n=1 Tax=Sagittula salina TaxID=2820268 RepID=UPI003CC9192D
MWFDPEMIWEAAPTGRRGRQQTYTNAAIQTCLSMKLLFGMALRQTTGFLESLLGLVGLVWSGRCRISARCRAARKPSS